MSEQLRKLDRLVGTWRLSGGAVGTIRYEWMEGGHFLLQHVDLVQDGQKIKGLEVIGHERPFGGEPSEEIKSRFYDSSGNTLDYVYEPHDDGTVTIWGGEKGSPDEYAARLDAVRQVLYLIFNEGYVATAGSQLQRLDLATEAIRLARMLHRLVPDDGEVAGLLALMLLTHARRDARVGDDGILVPLAEQDRSRWNRDEIAEGIALVTDAMSRTELGPYQVQAAIAAVHAEAPAAADTDWRQILGLYNLLERMTDNPVVTLNRAVAVAMVHGPRAGLTFLSYLDKDPHLTGQHRLEAVRAHLLELAGEPERARASYQRAAELTASQPERAYLLRKAAMDDSRQASP